MRPESHTGLHWSIRGTVLCGRHAKDIEDARWVTEEWLPLPENPPKACSSTSANDVRQMASRSPIAALAPATPTANRFASCIATTERQRDPY